MMHWAGHDPGWGAWLVMVGAMVAFWGLVVVAVVALFRTHDPHADTVPVDEHRRSRAGLDHPSPPAGPDPVEPPTARPRPSRP